MSDPITVTGSMTLETATAVQAQGLAALVRGASAVDLSGVTEVDSSGLAVLFAWQRAARERGVTLRVANPPANLVSLAQMYGVVDLLPMN